MDIAGGGGNGTGGATGGNGGGWRWAAGLILVGFALAYAAAFGGSVVATLWPSGPAQPAAAPVHVVKARPRPPQKGPDMSSGTATYVEGVSLANGSVLTGEYYGSKVFMRFAIPEAVRGGTVIAASLTALAGSGNSSPTLTDIMAKGCTESWATTDGAATLDGKTVGDALDTIDLPDAIDWRSWDVTDFVATVVSNAANTEITIVLHKTGYAAPTLGRPAELKLGEENVGLFNAKELATAVGDEPYLEITYIAAPGARRAQGPSVMLLGA